MKRVTVTVEDGLLEAAKAEVAAGRAPSVSAWVVDAMRHKLLARAELLAELEDMAAERPYSSGTVDWVAQAVGRSTEWVAAQLGVSSIEHRRAG
jgi:hypothetical protein